MDRLLVEKGLAASGQKARAVIMAGLVKVDGVPVDKPGRLFSRGSAVRLEKPPRYVSRGGLKLEAGLEEFSVDVRGKVLMDVGASTGGFTDCLLQYGARKVIAVDVGYGQLDWRLRQDPRVQVFEKTNIRNLKSGQLEDPVEGAVIDVSFISLKQAFPPVAAVLTKQAFAVTLIKPQFEVGKGLVGKGGVVRDPALHRSVLVALGDFFEVMGWTVRGHIPSPLLGPKGNREFLMYVTREAS